jgi:hypothetical protein
MAVTSRGVPAYWATRMRIGWNKPRSVARAEACRGPGTRCLSVLENLFKKVSANLVLSIERVSPTAVTSDNGSYLIIDQEMKGFREIAGR